MRSRAPVLRVGPLVVDWRITTRPLDAIDPDGCTMRRLHRGAASGDMTTSAQALPHTTGTVRWFDSARGHGFVTCDAGGPDCLFYRSSVRDEDLRLMEEGTRVAFDVLEGLGGPQSVNVRPL